MSLTRTLKVLVVLVVCVSMVFASGYQIGEHGARAMGMGGAYVAQASDGSAIFFNPAGLSFQKGFKVLLGATLITPATTFTGPTPSTAKTDMVSQTFNPIKSSLLHEWTKETYSTIPVGCSEFPCCMKFFCRPLVVW